MRWLVRLVNVYLLLGLVVMACVGVFVLGSIGACGGIMVSMRATVTAAAQTPSSLSVPGPAYTTTPSPAP